MSNTWMEWAIIAFITLTICWIVWKGGAANPMGTGRLSRKVGHLSGEVGRLEIRIGHVETEVDELKKEVATVKDIERVEALLNRTARGVERIERLFIEKGVNGK